MADDFLNRMAKRDAKMWAMAVSEFADIKALQHVLMALVRFQLAQSGVPEEEIDQAIKEWTAQYRAEAQKYSKTLLEQASMPQAY